MAGNLTLTSTKTLTGTEVDGTNGKPHPTLQAAEYSMGGNGNSSEVKAITNCKIFNSIIFALILTNILTTRI